MEPVSLFKHFEALAITLSDLKTKYAGQTGVWQVFSAPSRDELMSSHSLGYYEGTFEAVLQAVVKDHRQGFLDGPFCGEIVPITPKKV